MLACPWATCPANGKLKATKGSTPTMIGPQTKGASQGHFQVLDGTHAKIEQRLGTKLDRFNFTESLVGKCRNHEREHDPVRQRR